MHLLLAASSLQDVNDLMTGQSTVCKQRNLVHIPLLLLTQVGRSILSFDGNLKHILVNIAETIKAFDNTQSS